MPARRYLLLALVGALLVATPASASVMTVMQRAAEAPTPAPTPDPLDFNTALHLTPPLGQRSGTTNIADTQLASQLAVDICKYAGGSCAPVAHLTPTTSAFDKLYHTSWKSSQAGAKAGDVFKVTFRAAGLNIGSATLRAGSVLSTQVGNFPAGNSVAINFWVDRVPVIRTRSLHDVGASSVDVGQMLHNQFSLSSSDALTAVYRDVRTQDVLLGGSGLSALAALPSAFSLGQVSDSIASATTYGSPAKAVAEILKARTPLGNQSIVNSLVGSEVFHGVLSPGGLLTIIKDTLGVVDRIPGLNLLKNAQRDDGSLAFDATGVLKAIVEIASAPTTAVAAIQQLADVGFPADTSMLAIKAVDGQERSAGHPGLLPTDKNAAIATLAAAGLQTTQYSGGDIGGGLAAVFGGGAGDYNDSILSAAKGLVDGNCADYGKALQVGSVPDLLSSKTDVVGPSDVAKQLEVGSCGFDVRKAAAALHYVYFKSIPKPADEVVSIGQNLIKALPQTPASDVLLGLTSTLKDQINNPSDTFSCLASVGTVKGAVAAGLTGSALKAFSLGSVLGKLDTPQLSGLITNPFGTGVGGPLDQLGRCLVLNGIVPPLPLNRVTVDFNAVGIPAAAPSVGAAGVHGEMLVGRAGWAPDLSAVVPGRLGNLLDAIKVPSAGPLGALTGQLTSLLTLPVLAVGGPGHALSDALGCSGAGPGNTLFSRADYIHHYPFGGNDGCPARGGVQDDLVQGLGSDNVGVFTDGTLNGVPTAPISMVSGLTAGLTHNGRATFLVPALPGKVTIEGTVFGNNNLGCLSATPNPALYAAAIALPSSLYKVLVNGAGDRDIWATTAGSQNIDGRAKDPQVVSFKTYFATNDGKCGARTIRTGWIVGDDESDNWNRDTEDSGLAGTITVSRVGAASTVADVTALANQLAGKITVRNADPGDGGGDRGFGPLSGGTLAGVNGLLPGDVDGNFLSLLGAVGGQALVGNQIASLLGAGL